MSPKLKEEMNNLLVLNVLVESNYSSLDIELGVFVKNMRGKNSQYASLNVRS
jgi:hypothetical protein